MEYFVIIIFLIILVVTLKYLFSYNKKQIEEIAKLKMVDLNAASLESACSMIAGTARSMGITVEG